jgi:hypothetical protein
MGSASQPTSSFLQRRTLTRAVIALLTFGCSLLVGSGGDAAFASIATPRLARRHQTPAGARKNLAALLRSNESAHVPIGWPPFASDWHGASAPGAPLQSAAALRRSGRAFAQEGEDVEAYARLFFFGVRGGEASALREALKAAAAEAEEGATERALLRAQLAAAAAAAGGGAAAARGGGSTPPRGAASASVAVVEAVITPPRPVAEPAALALAPRKPLRLSAEALNALDVPPGFHNGMKRERGEGGEKRFGR